MAARGGHRPGARCESGTTREAALALELLTFLGLALLLEGVILALFPGGIRRMLDQFAALGGQQLRLIGLGFSVVAALTLVIVSRFTDNGGEGGISFAFPMTRRFVAELF